MKLEKQVEEKGAHAAAPPEQNPDHAKWALDIESSYCRDIGRHDQMEAEESIEKCSKDCV